MIAEGTYDYDRQGFQEEAREDGRRFAYRCDDRGQMREVETPRGDLIRYYYDKSGNLIRREAVIDGARVDHGETISVEDLTASRASGCCGRSRSLLRLTTWIPRAGELTTSMVLGTQNRGDS